MTYYAVCNANGPISVRLDAETKEAALNEFHEGCTESWIDEPRMDAEDDFDINGEGMSEDEFGEALKAAGCVSVCDLNPINNWQSGAVAHLADGWWLWAHGG